MLTGISHTVVCVRDLDRSIAFYNKLGLKSFYEGTTDSPIVGEVLGLDIRKARMAFMRFGDDPTSPFLDIVEFLDPPTQGSPYPTLNNVGLCRVAFSVDDIDQTYQHLQEMAVEFVTPLRRLPSGGAMVCFKDPDGTFLEIITELRR